ncbi:MAG: bifunctional metallophosphatase/5'-nucleotidase [Myxococcota bacterium]
MPRVAPLVITLFALLVIGCAAPRGQLRILHTTDVHGHLADGLTGIASIIDSARAEDPNVLLLDSGDMWSGTLMCDRSEGSLGIAAYNAMGYDAAAVGNHEFDYGPIGPERTGGDDPFAALKARLAEANFPLLSANLVDKASRKRPDWPNLQGSMMIERGGFLVGIVGATTEETASITFPHVGQALAFTDAAAAVTSEAQALRAKGADLVILISHIGGECTDLSDPDDLSSCDNDSELFQLVRALPRHLVDIALGGHTHRPVAHRVNGVVVAHTGAHGKHVMDLRVSGIAGALEISWAPPVSSDIEVTTKGPTRIALDAVLAPAIAEQRAQREELLDTKVIAPMTRDMTQSSPLGSFLCDVLLTLHPEREICILNSGGIRAPLPAGDLTYGQLYDVMPFGNYAANIELSGAALLEMLRLGTAGAHGVIQVAGLNVTYDPDAVDCGSVDRNGDGTIGPADRDRLVSAYGPGGAPIDPERTYRLLTNSFLASGGDGWRGVINSLPPKSVHILDHLLPIREQIGAWMRETRPILNSDDQPVMKSLRVRKVAQPKPASDARCRAN